MTTPNNKQAQHTPGPWEVRKFGIGMSGAHIAVPTGFSGSGAIIAVTSGADTIEPEQDKANARLIAAAPELLSIARQFVWLDAREGTSERLQRQSDETSGDGITEEGAAYLDAIQNARAAIAKAEGRAS